MNALLKSLTATLVLTTAALAQTPAPAPAPVPTDPAALLTALAARHQLHSPTAKPWHLRATVIIPAKPEVAAQPGVPARAALPPKQALIEEFFVSPHKNKLTISMPGFTQSRFTTDKGEFTVGDPGSIPYIVAFAYQQIVDPAPSVADIAESHPTKSTEPFGTVKLDCVALTQEFRVARNRNVSPTSNLGLFPTYCMQQDTLYLRVFTSFGTGLVTFDKIGQFLGNDVPIALTLSAQGVKLADVNVTALQALTTIDDAIFTPPPIAVEAHFSPVKIAPNVAASNLLQKIPPMYPPTARVVHLEGDVHLHATIGTDGAIRSLRVIDAPNADFAISAIAAAHRWTYKPYLLNGNPVEAETNITVVFDFTH